MGIMDGKRIMVVVSSIHGKKAVGLFELGVPEPASFFDYHNVPKPESYDPVNPIKTFYINKPPLFQISSVAACFYGKQQLLMIPSNDRLSNASCFSKEQIPNIIYDLLANKSRLIPSCHGRKYSPVTKVIGNQIFVLSFYIRPDDQIPEPCFEYFDLEDDKMVWEILPFPPFANISGIFSLEERSKEKVEEEVVEGGYRSLSRSYVRGYAFIQDKYILVCLSCFYEHFLFYSYSIKAKKWCIVFVYKPEIRIAKDKKKVPYLDREAVVIGNDIFRYHNAELYVFSYGIDKLDPNRIYLRPADFVEGLEHSDVPDPYDDKCCAVAIVDLQKKILCLLRTNYSRYNSIENICVSIVELVDRHTCITLQTFRTSLFTGEELLKPLMIESCHVIDLKETTEMDMDCDASAVV